MRFISFFLVGFVGSTAAVPAIIWDNTKKAKDPVVYSSKTIHVSNLLSSQATRTKESSLPVAVFVVGRSDEGNESLTGLATSGALSGVASKYDDATMVHSHVSGVENTESVARSVGAKHVVELPLNDFSDKLNEIGSAPPKREMEVDANGISTKPRARTVNDADVVIVSVKPSVDPKELDRVVVETLEHKNVDRVILTAVRSIEEKKLEKSRKSMNPNRRRLEDGQNAADDDQNQDDEVVYFVLMTPNILAGLLYGFMFIVVTWIGFSCMGMIEGQDTYVKKMPSIGREA